MPAIYHVKVVDDSFQGPVQHIIEAQPNDAVVWHCEEADANFDGAIFHVKWAAANFDGPVWRVLGIARSIVVVIGPGPSPLLLPDAIADSLSYVKAFGGTEQRNLPDDYIERQFIYMMEGSYLLTDIVPTYDCKVEMDFQTTSVPSYSMNLLGGRTETYGGLFFVKGASDVCIVDAFGTASDDRYTSSVSLSNNTRYKFIYDNQVATLTSGGTTLFTNTMTGTTANGASLVINGLNTNGSITTTNTGIYLYSFKVWNAQGKLVMNLVPAVQRGTVPVVGFYDTVSKTFKTATAGTFAAGGEAVPTPDAPMDIVSNNGVLKARHQSGLPLGYTLLDYIESTGTQYIDTGVGLDAVDKVTGKVAFLFLPTLAYIVGARGASSKAIGYALYASVHSGFTIYNSRWPDQGIDISTGQILEFETVMKDEQQSFVVDGDNVLSGNVQISGFINSNKITLFGLGYEYLATAKIYAIKFYKDSSLVADFIPASHIENNVTVVGMYDTVSGQFFTNQGTGDFVAGETVDDIEVYADGTVETIKDSLNNTATAEMLLKVGDYQDEQQILSGVVTRNIGVKVLDGTENWGLATAWGTHAFSLPRFDGGSGIVPLICSHNTDYAGSSIVSLNEQCTMRGGSFILSNNDYTNTSTTGFKQWLADQYNAGTPVIVVYPLATATTESVAGQTLQVQAGDNTLEITQASLSGLELEAEYQKGAL